MKNKTKTIKEVWTCDYCNKEFETKKEADEHEKKCDLNLETKETKTKNIKADFNNQNLGVKKIFGMNVTIQDFKPSKVIYCVVGMMVFGWLDIVTKTPSPNQINDIIKILNGGSALLFVVLLINNIYMISKQKKYVSHFRFIFNLILLIILYGFLMKT